MYPWLDRAGRLSPLKLCVFLTLFLPGLWLAFEFATATLGPKPVTEALHQTGSWAVRFLLISLAVTPFRRIADWPRLILVRRMLGLAALAYIVIHFILYMLDQQFVLATIASEIALRFYLTIGFVALTGLVILGVTSTDGMVRRLGAPRWNRLHQLVYLIAVLAIWHFFLQSKRDVTEPALMAGLFLLLMAYRLAVRLDIAFNLVSLSAIAALTGLLTALVEAGWYAVATGVPGFMVLSANIDPDLMWDRPSWWVAGVGIAVAVLGQARRRVAAPGRGRSRERPKPA